MACGRGHKNEELRKKIEEMAGENYSLTRIAEECGISKQRVSVILKEFNQELLFAEERVEKVIYKNVRERLIQRKITLSKVCHEIGENPYSTGLVTRFMYGQTDRLPIKTIKKILDYIDLTFEEAFAD